MSTNLTEVQLDLLRRLRKSNVGLSVRDLARSVQLPANVVNRELLELQRLGYLSIQGIRWKVREGVPLPSAADANQTIVPRQGKSPIPETVLQFTTPMQREVEGRIDRNRSRWRDFRNLCEYYAECVRLDQRVPIHGKAEDEDKELVCIPNRLPNALAFELEIPPSWNLWAREASGKHNYLFLGYPLHRYQWRDTSQQLEVTYCSPVFMVPCRFHIQRTRLTVEATGSIRINEGWLERRLKDLEQRRSFIQLCGQAESDDDWSSTTAPETWEEIAALLMHYYRDWCHESINPNHLSSSGRLTELPVDGIYNRATLVLPKSWKYTKRLHNELLQLANGRTDDDLDRSALPWLFPRNEPSAKSVAGREAAQRRALDSAGPRQRGAFVPSLNREQTQACEAAAEVELSIVMGPPGTGKSRVVQATLAQQAIGSSNALFASRNHQALEAVVPRINAITDPYSILLRLAQPFGAPADTSLMAAIVELVATGGSSDAEEHVNDNNRLMQRIAEKDQIRKAIEQIGVIRLKQNQQLADFDEALSDIASDKLKQRLVRHGEVPSSTELQSALKGVTACCNGRSFWQRIIDFVLRRNFSLQAEAKARTIDTQFRQWLDPEGQWPPAPQASNQQTLQFFQQALRFLQPTALANDHLVVIDQYRQELEQLPALENALEQELALVKQIESMSIDRLRESARRVGEGLSAEERTRLTEVLAAGRNRSNFNSAADEQRLSRALRKVYPVLLKHFPLAATTNLSVGRDVPLEPGLFDLVIIDEASQCDIASVIPLLFRARRAMIVGDPMQLPHVTTLAAATDKQLRSQFRLGAIEFERFSYRTVSMFDLAASSPRVGMRTNLRQHHRCHPDIADYCSETFYKGRWTVLTSRQRQSGLKWTHVADDCHGAPGGGVLSDNQIAAIVEELQRLASEQYAGSVGVVTPFRQQANRIRDRVCSALPARTLHDWKLLIDTADGFQGDERDIVLMSLPGGKSMPVGSKNFLSNGPNRFNVAVSRARRLLHVFADSTWAMQSGVKHIAHLCHCCQQAVEAQQTAAEVPFRADLVGPVWEPLLAETMSRAGIEFFQQYPTCGSYLDFAIFPGSAKLNIEVDGESYHRSARGDRKTADLDRDQVLIAHGWNVMRFWVYELKEDLAACMERIEQRIRELDDAQASHESYQRGSG